MATNEGVRNRSADDGTLYCGRRSAEYFGSADGGGYLCSDPISILIIFSVLMTRSARGITTMIQKWLDKLRVI